MLMLAVCDFILLGLAEHTLFGIENGFLSLFKAISSTGAELTAHTEEHLIILSPLDCKQPEPDQSINKCNAPEEKFNKELSERENKEKLWLGREHVLMMNANKAGGARASHYW